MSGPADEKGTDTIRTPGGPVSLDPRALAAHGLTAGDVAAAWPGTVLVMADGTALRVTPEGALDPVQPFGFKSIASDPAATPRAR